MEVTSKAALFCSGVFFGGAVDHTILALKRATRTPYGLKSGVGGNWSLAALDALLAAALYALHRRQDVSPSRRRARAQQTLFNLP